jgi:CHAD domain-containing protein
MSDVEPDDSDRSSDSQRDDPGVNDSVVGDSVVDDVVSAGVWCEVGSARAAIATAISRSVSQLDLALPGARAGEDPEGVHQARVATRRLRSDLHTFEPLLHGDWVARTRDDLKVLADALGSVRDTDVLAMRFERGLDDAGIETAAAAPILAVLAAQGRHARLALVDVLDQERTARLIEALHAAAEDPPTTLSAVGSAEIRLLPLVRRPWHKLDRAVARLGDEPQMSELHRVRLLAKRARYAAEAVEPVFGRRARRFATAVTGVQDVLGEMHDAEVAVEWLTGTAPQLDPAPAFVAGELAHHFRGVAATHRHGWERAFARARKRSAWLRD